MRIVPNRTERGIQGFAKKEKPMNDRQMIWSVMQKKKVLDRFQPIVGMSGMPQCALGSNNLAQFGHERSAVQYEQELLAPIEYQEIQHRQRIVKCPSMELRLKNCDYDFRINGEQRRPEN